MTIRLTFVDGSMDHFDNVIVMMNGVMVKAMTNNPSTNTYIPMARIHKYVELAERK
jgi:hypothetical protein